MTSIKWEKDTNADIMSLENISFLEKTVQK